jgi:hypothetical protein
MSREEQIELLLVFLSSALILAAVYFIVAYVFVPI